MEYWQIFLAAGFILAAIGVAAALFSPIAWIYSALFSRRKHRRLLDDLRRRINLTVERYGRDPLTNKKNPSHLEKAFQKRFTFNQTTFLGRDGSINSLPTIIRCGAEEYMHSMTF